MSEAKALLIKRKYDPEGATSILDQNNLLLGGDADFMIVSDDDSESSSESDGELQINVNLEVDADDLPENCQSIE